MIPPPKRRPQVPRGTSLLLVEPDPWRSESLEAFLLQEGYEVRLTDSPGFSPQLALIDFRNPSSEIRSLYEETKTKYPDMRTVAFVEEVNSGTVFPCLILGIKGVLPVSAGGDELLLALSTVLEGSVWTPRAVLSQWIDRIASLGLSSGIDRAFTVAERKVLDGLRDALSNKEIARRVGIAEATVKFHIGRLLKKTGTKDRRELARFVADAAPLFDPLSHSLPSQTKG